MGKGGRVRGKVTVRWKRERRSNKGGSRVAKKNAVNKKQNTRNG